MSAADQIRALVDSGTPGPWHRNRDWIDAGEYDEVLAPAPVDCMAYCYGGSSRIELSDADAAKIVAFVNAGPALADLIEAIDEHRRHRRPHGIGITCDGCFRREGDIAAARDALVAALGVTS